MCDEGTDCSDLEQLPFNIRTVDENLDTHEDLLGFCEVHSIKSDTIVAAIENIILRLRLSFEFCCGQIYDGVSSMVDKKSGVASTEISSHSLFWTFIKSYS